MKTICICITIITAAAAIIGGDAFQSVHVSNCNSARTAPNTVRPFVVNRCPTCDNGSKCQMPMMSYVKPRRQLVQPLQKRRRISSPSSAQVIMFGSNPANDNNGNSIKNDENNDNQNTTSPPQNWLSQKLQWWNRQMSKPTKIIKSFGRGGLIAYGLLNAAWYGFAVLWQWKRVSSSAAAVTTAASAGASHALRASIRKFTTVLTTVYIGSQITKLPRLYLAVVLAPFGDYLLTKTREILGVSEGVAMGIVVSLLLACCFGIWGVVIVGDATMSSIGR